MKQITIQTSGWIGIILVLVGYAMVTFSVIPHDSLLYFLLNIFGAIGIIISSISKKDIQPVVLNIIWLLIAAVGIITIAT